MRKRRVWFFAVFLFFALACGCSHWWQKKVVPPKYPDIWMQNNTLWATTVLIVNKINEAAYCTAWVVGRQGNTFYFITASHCLSADVGGQIAVEPARLEFYFSVKAGEAKKVYIAEIIAVGYLGVRDDLAILQVELDGIDLPTLKLAEKDPVVGQCLFNVSYPSKAFGNLFYGFVGEVKSDGEVHFKVDGVTGSGGASGSALVDCKTGEVLAVWIESKKDIYYIALSVSKLKKFLEAIENDTYKYYKKSKKFKVKVEDYPEDYLYEQDYLYEREY